MAERVERKCDRIDILLKALVAALCVAQVLIAQTISTNQVTNTFHEISRNPLLYLAGTVMLFLLFYAVALFSRRTLLVSGIIAAFFNFIAFVNYYELQLHGTVLTVQDVKNIPTAARALGGYTIQITSETGAIFFSFSILLFVLAVFYSKGVSFKSSRKAGAFTLLLLCFFTYCLVFSPFSPLRFLDGWSWEIRYYVDSVPVGVTENIRRALLGIEKPEGYDVTEITDITGLPGSDNRPDIIFVLNETWYDMDHLIDFNTDVSYMENYDALDDIKGYATVPMIGGGTNASEYELLTGNSMMLVNTTTPFNDLNLNDSKSIAEYLKKMGYATMAAHTEPAGNYHRGDAWKALGFDVTYFQPDMRGLEYYEARYSASDSSLFRNFTRFYEAMPEDQPRFAYLLTIQNHGGWDRNSPDKDTVHIQDSQGFSEYEQQINEYLTCIQQTDDFIGEMVEYFSNTGRDVIVCMVGDHGPSFLREWDLGEEYNLSKRQVPYFIWSNKGTEEAGSRDTDGAEDEDADGTVDVDGNVATVAEKDAHRNVDICALAPMALKAADMPLSAYYTQILRLSENVQVLTGGSDEYIDKNGDGKDIYSGIEEAELVRKYYYMEYNSLLKKGRIDALFDP